MKEGLEIEYHAERAVTEFELGLRCHDRKAARAHVTLGKLHMERVRTLQTNGSKPS